MNYWHKPNDEQYKMAINSGRSIDWMKSRNGTASINNNESKTIGKMNVNREMNNEKSID